MRDFCLRFPDEAAALPLLYVGDGDDARPRFRALDVIGTIYAADGSPLPGWHANVRAYPDEHIAALEPFAVHPQSPRRVWA